MGLDMYLTKRRYVKNWGHMKPEERHTITIKKGGKPVTSKLEISEIEAAYWRKANAIHNWFVNNVQDGEDDCKEYYVDREKLQALLDLCKQVLKIAKTKKGKVHNGSQWTPEGGSEEIYEDGVVVTNPEEVGELLPPVEGFFFGSTDIDSYYLDDVKSTVEQLEKALADGKEDNFYYQSSW